MMLTPTARQMYRSLTREELKAHALDASRLPPEHVEANREWFERTETYEREYKDFQTALAMQRRGESTTEVFGSDLPDKPVPWWGPGPMPKLPPHLPRIETKLGRPPTEKVASTSLALKIPNPLYARLLREAETVEPSVYILRLLDSVLPK